MTTENEFSPEKILDRYEDAMKNADGRRNLIVFDLDGTLANNDHRQHLAKSRKFKEWEARAGDDKPIAHICDIFRGLQASESFELVIACGRRTDDPTTLTWLESNGLKPNKILWRKPGDFSRETDLKEGWMIGGQLPKDRILMAFEDRRSDTVMWKQNGVTVIEVARGEF